MDYVEGVRDSSNTRLLAFVRKLVKAALWVLIHMLRLTTSLLEGEMARATVAKTTEKFPLTTIEATEQDPEGGWVELRRLAYGEKLQKDAEAMKMRFAMDDARSGSKGIDAEVSLISEFVTLAEFAKCIVAHNLTGPIDPNDDTKGERPLDFRKPEDVRALDPRVGDEISTLIGELNDFEKAVRTNIMDASGK